MKVAVAVSREIDDMSLAAKELASDIRKQITICKNSIGILYYDYETDGDLLSAYLHDEFHIDVMGCSSVATVDGEEGYREMSVVFTLMTGDDCEFASLAVPSVTEDDYIQILDKFYNSARAELASDPKLIYMLPSLNALISADFVLQELTKLSHGAPIIGGIPSNSGAYERSIVYNGEILHNQWMLILISGAIKPIISIANVSTTISERTGVATKVSGNELIEVDGMSASDFLSSYGVDEGDLGGENAYLRKYPFLVSDKSLAEFEHLPYLRMMAQLNNDKSISLYGSIPQGAKISLTILTREDIDKTVKEALLELLGKITQESEYKYSFIFCISCSARRFIMTPLYNIEGDSIKEMLPDGLKLSGFYSDGEICPTCFTADKVVNKFHNASVIFCAV